ncbi:MAG: 3-keto-disaccharide hydrolase, partial [Flavobacteriaceae bacterium]
MKYLLTAFLTLATLGLGAQTALFNGENLEGWTINGTEKWYVEDGLLVCESGPDKAYGYLSTNEYYDDFVLELEFLQEADGNSGVFFRSTVEGTVVSGWQVEVAPPDHDTGGIYESYGRGWLIKPEKAKDAYLKMGEWNK